MTKRPVIHALLASLYIVLIAVLMTVGTRHLPKEDTIMAPIAMVSLFTLSAAVMGYLFCFEPLQMYFDGKKKAAVTFFLQTLAMFAILTIIALVLLFSGAFL